MLILDIYDYADAVLTPRLQTEKARLWDHWEKGWSKDLESGMFCRMYYPKMEGDLSPLDVCPPALVFRGSEMEKADIDELAVHTEVTCTVSATGLPGMFIDTQTFSPPIPVVSPTGRFAPSDNREKIRNAGLLEQPLVLPTTGREVLSMSLGGAIGLGNINIDWAGSASLFYGKNGDWPTNISQALGIVPPQYKQAIEAAKEAAKESMNDWNGRLLIMGHSLGGGLASCAALAAKHAQSELDVRCSTYNAAGLAQATANEAGASLSDAPGSGIIANAVSGDVLTSLQTKGLVPLVSDVLRWGNVELPPAIPTSAPTHGTSPGANPGMMFSHHERAPEWDPLPVLLPLQNQNLVKGDLDTIPLIFDAAANADDFAQFVENLIQMLFNQLGDQNGHLRTWHIADFYSGMEHIQTEFVAVSTRLLPVIQENPPSDGFPTVDLGNSNYLNNQVEPFVNGLIRDGIEFAQIMYATVDYHMWDACAYTFLLSKDG